MNKELKQKWLAALRSGEYKQGEGKLYNPLDNSYCCLGVLCDLVRDPKEDWQKCENQYMITINDIEIGQNGWAMSFGDGPIPDGFPLAWHQKRIAVRNDDGQTFEQIADWIDENL